MAAPTPFPDFKEGYHRQAADIIVNGAPRGKVEVVYAEENPSLMRVLFTVKNETLSTPFQGNLNHRKTKEAEDEQSRLQEQLRHADRLSTIGQLAASMAHELNEPLGNILGFGQLAKKVPWAPHAGRTRHREDLDRHAECPGGHP